MNRKQKKMLKRILIALACLVVIGFIPVSGKIKALLYLIPYVTVGYEVLRKSVKQFGKGQFMDENFLMAVATIGAMLLGEYLEGVAVMLFYQVGELFEGYAVGKSRRNIGELMDIRPEYANLQVDGTLQKCSPDEVAVGSRIYVFAGEKVPIDGVVMEGTSTLDTSALTGESMPRKVKAGETIISGSVNLEGTLVIETSKKYEDSTVAKIFELVENASSRKSRSEAFITRFAKYYTPIVCISALLLAIVPPVVLLALGKEALWRLWVYRALTFLVISCPCALVISIPLTFFAGIGACSSHGILVKGSNYLEALASVTGVVADKTGTMTEGSFAVRGIYPEGMTKEELLHYAVHGESFSNHPISQSLKQAYPQTVEPERVREAKEISGEGVAAFVDGRQVLVGNAKLMKRYFIETKVPQEALAGTQVLVAVDGRYAGVITIADQIKQSTKAAIAEYRRLGVTRVVMLTGDSRAAAEEVAGELGLSEVYSELLPGDKVTIFEKILSEKKPKEQVAFLGDGINDAPVLARADVGVAMGAMGSDAAIEAADVVLMDDDPGKLALAIRLSRKGIAIVYQNIVFAIGVKVLCLVLGAFGIANMWLAIFADVGVMVLAVLNAIRILADGKRRTA